MPKFLNYYTDVLKKYTVFTGRAARKEYWYFILIHVIIMVLLSIIGSIVNMEKTFELLKFLYCLAVLLPVLGVTARRLHDTDRSGWWMLISLIPVIGGIILIVFLAMDSKPGDNKYGPNPKGMSTPVSPVGGTMGQM